MINDYWEAAIGAIISAAIMFFVKWRAIKKIQWEASKKAHDAYKGGLQAGYQIYYQQGLRRGKVSPEQKSFPRPDADEVLCGGPRHTEQEEATE